MYEWFDCHLSGCGGFTEYFPAAGPRRPRTNLAELPVMTAMPYNKYIPYVKAPEVAYLALVSACLEETL